MNKKLIRAFIGLSLPIILLTTGCASYVAGRYTTSVDNNVALRAWKGTKINVSNFTDSTNSTVLSCNYKGDIATLDGESYVQFIQNALINELKFADAYSNQAEISITGNLDMVDNSTVTGTDWTFVMTMRSSNGKSVTITENYKYNGSIVGTPASTCGASAAAFVPAVQNLIGKIIQQVPNLI